MATIRPRSQRDASSSSPITGIPACRAVWRTGWFDGTPGLSTIRSARANVAGVCPPSSSATPAAARSAASASSGRTSDSVTAAPRRTSSCAAATPLRAAPTTTTCRPSTENTGWSVIAASTIVRLNSAKMIATIRNRAMTFGSLQPASSKWWCRGAILKTRLPVVLNEATWTMTESASSTNTPPTITSRNSCLMRSATVPSAPPRPSDPTSPMKISAG